MARLNVTRIIATTSGIGSVWDFVAAAKKLSAAHSGAPVSLSFKGLPVVITMDTDVDEAAQMVERSTGLLSRETLSLFTAAAARDATDDRVTRVHFSDECADY